MSVLLVEMGHRILRTYVNRIVSALVRQSNVRITGSDVPKNDSQCIVLFFSSASSLEMLDPTVPSCTPMVQPYS
jgi:hypothetical protein